MVHFIAYGTIILYYGDSHCVKSVSIRSYSGPNNSEYGQFSPNVFFGEWYPAEDWS